ncbi:TPA: hypothetical protein MW110_002864 [Acinetobacter baumannii]|nr:hypothetical protein [Acinetobacter baumannii]
MLRNTKYYKFASAIFAFLLWGGWSFYINTQVSNLVRGVVAGFVQGVSSFTITLFIAFLIERQFNFYKKAWAKLIFSPILTVLLTGSALILVHVLFSTPDIIKTITPALTVAFIFAEFSNLKLYKRLKATRGRN